MRTVLERFAALVAAAEREAIIEMLGAYHISNAELQRTRAAIRARGEKE